MKTIEEVVAALATRLPAESVKRVSKGAQGTYDYVPWETTASELDRIFGPFGWEERIINQAADTARGVYSVTRELTGYATENGEVVDITRVAVGAKCSAGDRPDAHANAMKSADSDSFSRAAKKLGDAFGRYLYDKDDDAHAPQGTPRLTTIPGGRTDTGPRPSDKQAYNLLQMGWTKAELETLPFQTWKAALDAYFTSGKTATKDTYQPAEAIPF